MKAFAALLISVCVAVAQTTAMHLSFEVVSVKPAPPDPAGQACLCEPPGRIAYRTVPLKWVIERAYQLQDPQILGPAWLSEATFNIDATLPAGATARQMPFMLQNLLEERFQFVAHVEDREVQAYTLELARGGAKMPPATDTSPVSWSADKAGTHLHQKMSMPDLAYYLSIELDHPVLNETGLEGAFAIALDFVADGDMPKRAPNAAPPLSVAVQQQLGLTLRPGKRLAPTLVIDHVAKAPTEN